MCTQYLSIPFPIQFNIFGFEKYDNLEHISLLKQLLIDDGQYNYTIIENMQHTGDC